MKDNLIKKPFISQLTSLAIFTFQTECQQEIQKKKLAFNAYPKSLSVM